MGDNHIIYHLLGYAVSCGQMPVASLGVSEHFLAQITGGRFLWQVLVFVMPVGIAMVRILGATFQANVHVIYLGYSLT